MICLRSFAPVCRAAQSDGVNRVVTNDLEPLAVSPRQACRLLGVGNTRLYQLIGVGELASYRDGRARRITVESIRRRIARLVAAANANSAAPLATPRRRSRPRKHPTDEVTA
jgi:excisionase family DNA binding protein